MSKLSRRDLVQALAVAAAVPFGATHANLAFASPPTPGRRAAPRVPETITERFASLPFESQEIGGILAERMKISVEGRLLHIDEKTFLEGFVHHHATDDFISTWVGEHAGKFLDAACNSLRYRENADLRRLVARVAKTLIDSQGADGYLGTYTDERRWTDWDVWTHKYNLIGLLSYYETTGDAAALTACRKMGDLLCRIFGEAPGQRDIAAGGGNTNTTSVLEPMCALYRFTGEARYLEFCRYIVRAYDHPDGPHIVSTLLREGRVHLVGNAHAYTMMSNLNGLIDLYRLTADQTLLSAVMRAWDDIVQHQLYFTGTVSPSEHFRSDGRLLSLPSSNVGETCATVTWLQLNWRLLRLTGEARFGQEIERTVYNHLLAAQDPRSGNISYFTALAGHKEHNAAPLCCVSSGPRGISLIPRLTWGLAGNAFVVNLYVAGRADFEIDGAPVQVISETQFPLEGDISLSVRVARPTHFTVRLRVPEWATRFQVTVGSQTFTGQAGRMLDITRTWSRSSALKISMDLPIQTLDGGATYPDYLALKRGPQVLALEKAVNPTLPYIHRTALRGASGPPVCKPVAAPAGWAERQVYEVDGIAGMPAPDGQLDLQRRPLVFVPFADTVDYSVWVTREDRLRRDVPAVTVFARSIMSVWSRQAIPEFLTDENPASFCAADQRDPSFAGVLLGEPARQRGDPMWFAVVLAGPQTITRIVFRHGATDDGWFDASAGKPRIEVLRSAVPKMWGFVPDVFRPQWESVAVFDSYPSVHEAAPESAAGRMFEVRLPQAMTVHAIRLIGKPLGDYVACAELGAYA